MIGTGYFPESVGVNPTTNAVFVAYAYKSVVSVINGATNLTGESLQLPAGSKPQGVGVNATTNLIYVANTGTGTVSVIAN
jgi:DNA-binding beta-propeller fold protein YncE